MQAALSELPRVAKKILKRIAPGDVITLSGPLAAGKTTLISALLTAMGYAGHVASPTFVIERRYPVNYKKIKEVIHLDFYRLSPDQTGNLDWTEHAGDPETVTFIEWPEKAVGHLPPEVKSIELAVIDEHTRHLTFSENFDC